MQTIWKKMKQFSENVEIWILKCCAEMFIRGNVWGAPLSGLGNGPCNSDGGENAPEIQEKSKRYHSNQEILMKMNEKYKNNKKDIIETMKHEWKCARNPRIFKRYH